MPDSAVDTYGSVAALGGPAEAVRLGTASGRNAGIDLLRGVCVTLVVLHHIHLRFRFEDSPVQRALPRMAAVALFASGYYSVIAFFVISGFLITRLSLERFGALGRIHLPDFYRLRIARIAPCLLLLLAVLAFLHLTRFENYVIRPERASLGRALVAGLTFHINWLEGHHGYLPGGWDVLWSLSVEEVFYLGFPLLCVLLRRPRFIGFALLALGVVAPCSRVALEGQTPWEDYAYLSNLDALAIGCGAVLLSNKRRIHARRLLGWLGAALMVLVVVLRPWAVALGLIRFSLQVTVLELGVALLLASFAGTEGSTASAWTAGLRLVGRCSYEIYLTHMFVVFGVLFAFLSLKVDHALLPLVYIVTFVGSVVLGWLVSRVYSEPLNRRLRRRFGLLARA